MERTLDYTFNSLNLIETNIDARMLNYRTATEDRKLAEQAIRRLKEEIKDDNSQLNLVIQHAWINLARKEFTDDMGSGAYASVNTAFCMADLAMETEIRHNFEGDIPAPEELPTDNELLAGYMLIKST